MGSSPALRRQDSSRAEHTSHNRKVKGSNPFLATLKLSAKAEGKGR